MSQRGLTFNGIWLQGSQQEVSHWACVSWQKTGQIFPVPETLTVAVNCWCEIHPDDTNKKSNIFFFIAWEATEVKIKFSGNPCLSTQTQHLQGLSTYDQHIPDEHLKRKYSAAVSWSDPSTCTSPKQALDLFTECYELVIISEMGRVSHLLRERWDSITFCYANILQ